MNQPTRELKQIRADLDVLIGMAKNIPSSRYVALAFTSLEAGKMHIGNTLFEIGTAPIYKESMNASNTKIEAYHIDQEINPIEVPGDWNEGLIQNVKIMRRELDYILQKVRKLLFHPEFSRITDPDCYAILFLTEAIVKLRETQNWFGMELGRIRETQLAQS